MPQTEPLLRVAVMVHTTHHKTPTPRPKHTYPAVTYWKANEGLMLVGALLTAPDTHKTTSSLVFSPFIVWP